jgi:hypothetical protein
MKSLILIAREQLPGLLPLIQLLKRFIRFVLPPGRTRRYCPRRTDHPGDGHLRLVGPFHPK